MINLAPDRSAWPPANHLRQTRTSGRGVTSSLGLLLVVSVMVLGGCANAPFVAAPVEQAPFMQRAVVQTQGPVTVAAAVPDPAETRELIGIDLYAKGIQPVWLQVTNLGTRQVRAAIRSIEDEYYSPMEVAWKFRRHFSKQGRDDMQRWFHDNQLQRRVPPGATRSGFVFTHATSGSKGFNFDVYTSQASFNFTFFVRMPGFVADYMDVDFDRLYAPDEIQIVDLDRLRIALEALPCCSTNEAGDGTGDPVNVVIVATRLAMRRSLLRARWSETAKNDPGTTVSRTHRVYRRQPDATFHKARPDGSERKELRIWASPIRLGDTPVWIGQVSYDMSGKSGADAFRNYRIDPDIDDARMFLLQNFWYSQSLARMAFVGGIDATTIDAPAHNFSGAEYFTDGRRVVLFLSEQPVAMDETDVLPWEELASE